jgi:peptidoglycan/xylan/chitin deacetylase (PgdA/CDA1 family)
MKSIVSGKRCLTTLCHFMRLDSLFRYLNRKKLLVVMYHGVTANNYDPPVWTQLPVNVFREHVGFLRDHYSLISLADLASAISGEGKLPSRAALITFDDGLKNNYSVVFPILKQMKIPAAIFLTVDLIGSEEMLWFDELFLLVREIMLLGRQVPLADGTLVAGSTPEEVWSVYDVIVNSLKRSGSEVRNGYMKQLRERHSFERESYLGDFGLLNWQEVMEMERSGLVGFGVHTATHRILSELAESEWEDEIAGAKATMESSVGHEVTSFCFPNGRPGLDFSEGHVEYLKKCGYVCSFTTCNDLFSLGSGDRFQISRIPAGNDATSSSPLFQLNASGLIQFGKRMVEKVTTRE